MATCGHCQCATLHALHCMALQATGLCRTSQCVQARPGEARRLRSLEGTLDSLQRLLRALSQHCGWAPGRVHLLGFSQGGTTALELALRCASGGFVVSLYHVAGLVLHQAVQAACAVAYMRVCALSGLSTNMNAESPQLALAPARCPVLLPAGPGGGLGSCVAISASLLEERLEQQPAKNRPAGQQGKPSAAAAGGSGSRGGSSGDSKAASYNKGRGPHCAPAGGPPSLPQVPGPVPHKDTPVLLTHGTADRVVARGLVERSMQLMRSAHGMGDDVTLRPVPGKGHGMVQGPDEMKGLMEFWSRVLSRRPTGQGELREPVQSLYII